MTRENEEGYGRIDFIRPSDSSAILRFDCYLHANKYRIPLRKDEVKQKEQKEEREEYEKEERGIKILTDRIAQRNLHKRDQEHRREIIIYIFLKKRA